MFDTQLELSLFSNSRISVRFDLILLLFTEAEVNSGGYLTKINIYHFY